MNVLKRNVNIVRSSHHQKLNSSDLLRLDEVEDKHCSYGSSKIDLLIFHSIEQDFRICTKKFIGRHCVLLSEQ